MPRRSRAVTDQWNVPDWRDKTKYPVPLPEKNDSDLMQWRWEFLRRDEEYRQDWLRVRAKDPEGKLALLDDPTRYDPSLEFPLLVKEQYKDPLYFQKKYKLKKLLNPTHKNPCHLNFYPFPSNFVTLTFDLDKPIRQELRRAEKVLKETQKSLKGVTRRATYPEKKKWPLFLRAIDAQDNQLSLSEIGYQILDLDRARYDRNQAKTNASSFLKIGRRFWKDLPIPRSKKEQIAPHKPSFSAKFVE